MIPISVALLPGQLPNNWALGQSLAVVIDTLRFTSTACTALAAGAHCVRVVSHIDDAKALAADHGPSAEPARKALLCGERNCVRIDGFDLGNSPAEYTAQAVAECELIFSTTNGTVAVEAAASAAQVVLGSLLNRGALVDWIKAWQQQLVVDNLRPASLWLVCAGTDGQVALEDVITAGAIIELLDWPLGNDSAWLAFNSWQNVNQSRSLLKQLQLARGGANLIEAGFGEDIKAILHVDSLSVVPMQTSTGIFKALTLT